MPNRNPGTNGPPNPINVIDPQYRPILSTIRCVLVRCSAVRREMISQAGELALTVSWARVASEARVADM